MERDRTDISMYVVLHKKKLQHREDFIDYIKPMQTFI